VASLHCHLPSHPKAQDGCQKPWKISEKINPVDRGEGEMLGCSIAMYKHKVLKRSMWGGSISIIIPPPSITDRCIGGIQKLWIFPGKNNEGQKHNLSEEAVAHYHLHQLEAQAATLSVCIAKCRVVSKSSCRNQVAMFPKIKNQHEEAALASCTATSNSHLKLVHCKLQTQKILV